MDGNKKQRRFDEGQRRLPYEREHRFQALKALDRSKLGVKVGGRAWANVVDLLIQIDLCTGRDGCFAYAETLAARMAGGVGVSRATFFRTRKLAEDLKFLIADQRFNNQGQQSNQWFVQWDRIMVIGGKVVDEKLRPTETHPRVKLRPTGRKLRPPRLILTHCNKGLVSSLVSTSIRSTSDQSKSSRVDRREIDWEEARRVANTAVRKIGPCRSAGDRSLVLKAAVLVGRFGEDWLYDSVEAVVRKGPPNRFGYLHRCLTDKCETLGLNFNRELAVIEIPPELLAPRMASDLTERLCDPGGAYA